MTDYITPPPELLQQWMTEFYGTHVVPGEACTDLAIRAAQWGADQELEACAKWVGCMFHGHKTWSDELRADRRPKPPTPKEQALALLQPGEPRLFNSEMQDTLRRALEALPE
jgi:hypothetical protein